MRCPEPAVRPYPTNSAEAVARTVAMVMITDARLSADELDALDKLGVCARVGLDRPAFERVLRECCADLRCHSAWDGRLLLLDRDRVDAMLKPILDPDLRDRAWQCMQAMAGADGEICDSEQVVLEYVRRHWALEPRSGARVEPGATA
jgi:hypothetical protein